MLELRFCPSVRESEIQGQVKALANEGMRNFLFLSALPEPAAQLSFPALERMGLSCEFADIDAEEAVANSPADVLFILSDESERVSRALHTCMQRKAGIVVAPVTERHISRYTVYLSSIPKAGTHLLLTLLDALGVGKTNEYCPQPGKWSCIPGYAYHAPCREFLQGDAWEPMGRHPAMCAPILFIYRNPLDVLVSELNWYGKPEHAFYGLLEGMEDAESRISHLLLGRHTLGTLRDRINRYSGWLDFQNVVPVSYEELVGADGGGSNDEQLKTIWSIQLKLQIPGKPAEFAARIRGTDSKTFHCGRAWRHLEAFSEKNRRELQSLDQDFMQLFGYEFGQLLPARIEEFRSRPLRVKRLTSEQYAEQILVRESYYGWNVVYAAGGYIPIRQGCSPTTQELLTAAWQEGKFMRLDDALMHVVHENNKELFQRISKQLFNERASEKLFSAETARIENLNEGELSLWQRICNKLRG